MLGFREVLLQIPKAKLDLSIPGMDNRLLLTFLFVMLSWTCTRAQTTVAVTEESGYDDPMVTEDPVLELTLATDDPTYDVSLPVDITTGAPTEPATEAPLGVDTTVTLLETTISSDKCGTESLCGEEPADCNPGNPGNCLFLAAKRKKGQNYEFEMSGESDGYVACTFSPDGDFGNNETTYICANHNGKVKFFTARYNKNKMVKTELPANSVKGKITQNKIQCSFLAALPLGALRAEDNVAMSLSTGDYDAASGDLGTPAFKYQSPVVNLANPNSAVPNVITTTAAPTNAPTAAPTTSHAVPFHKSVLQGRNKNHNKIHTKVHREKYQFKPC
ncbi:uncharacterized protein LOC103384810 isoform X2 [Cynoglossus semilaevis]|uniref:uncharacterized protein LOC103384810 isoform X2 n=1 Tax=Cynoglossus semilaevis TaxID=244447 RepID=UPI000D627FE6|nr:uncharacterized protein LOC103384810 isoform X2 [Cynoglossus semilaevis]